MDFDHWTNDEENEAGGEEEHVGADDDAEDDDSNVEDHEENAAVREYDDNWDDEEELGETYSHDDIGTEHDAEADEDDRNYYDHDADDTAGDTDAEGDDASYVVAEGYTDFDVERHLNMTPEDDGHQYEEYSDTEVPEGDAIPFGNSDGTANEYDNNEETDEIPDGSTSAAEGYDNAEGTDVIPENYSYEPTNGDHDADGDPLGGTGTDTMYQDKHENIGQAHLNDNASDNHDERENQIDQDFNTEGLDGDQERNATENTFSQDIQLDAIPPVRVNNPLGRSDSFTFSRKNSMERDPIPIVALYPEESTATVVPDAELLIDRRSLKKTVTNLDTNMIEVFHNSEFDDDEARNKLAEELEHLSLEHEHLSPEELVKQRLREEKLRAKEHAEREKSKMELEYAAMLANEEKQREERWKQKENARLARQQAKHQAEVESARLMSERIAKRKEEEAKLIKEEDDSFEQLMKLRGNKIPALNTDISKGEVHFLAKTLEAHEFALNSKITPKHADNKTGAAPVKKRTVWDSVEDTPPLEHAGGKRPDASSLMAQLSPFSGANRKTPTSSSGPLSSKAQKGPKFTFSEVSIPTSTSASSAAAVIPMDHNNHPMATSKPTKPQLNFIIGGVPVMTNPLQKSSRNFTNSDIRLIVKSIIFPSLPLGRRLKLWALTEGFIYTSPAQLDAALFGDHCRHQTVSVTQDAVMTDVSQIHVNQLRDWADFICALKEIEQKHDLDAISAADLGHLMFIADVYLVPKPIGVFSKGGNGNSQTSNQKGTTNANNSGSGGGGVPPMSKLCCEGLILEAADDRDIITKKICAAIPSFAEAEIRPLVDELYVSKENPLIVGWELMKKELSCVEEIILYQEFTIEDLKRRLDEYEEKMSRIDDSYALDSSRYDAPKQAANSKAIPSPHRPRRLVAASDKGKDKDKEKDKEKDKDSNKSGTSSAATNVVPAVSSAAVNSSKVSDSNSLNLSSDSLFEEADLNKDGVISRDEWRKWVDEKQRMIRNHNKEKADMLLELKQLRKLLDPRNKELLNDNQTVLRANVQLEESSINANIKIDTLNRQLSAANKKVSALSASMELSSNIWKQQFSALLMKCVRGERLTDTEYEAAKRFAKSGPNIVVETNHPSSSYSGGTGDHLGSPSVPSKPASPEKSQPLIAQESIPKTSVMGSFESRYPTLSAPQRYPGRSFEPEGNQTTASQSGSRDNRSYGRSVMSDASSNDPYPSSLLRDRTVRPSSWNAESSSFAGAGSDTSSLSTGYRYQGTYPGSAILTDTSNSYLSHRDSTEIPYRGDVTSSSSVINSGYGLAPSSVGPSNQSLMDPRQAGTYGQPYPSSYLNQGTNYYTSSTNYQSQSNPYNQLPSRSYGQTGRTLLSPG